jgi:predicted RNA-binding protein
MSHKGQKARAAVQKLLEEEQEIEGQIARI